MQIKGKLTEAGKFLNTHKRDLVVGTVFVFGNTAAGGVLIDALNRLSAAEAKIRRLTAESLDARELDKTYVKAWCELAVATGNMPEYSDCAEMADQVMGARDRISRELQGK